MPTLDEIEARVTGASDREPSLSAQIEEVIYELKMRENVYPRLKGFRAAEAREHMRRMTAVLHTLRKLEDHPAEKDHDT